MNPFFHRQNALFCLFIGLLSAAVLDPVSGLDNGLALTPPMGWNSWNKFGCDVSEKLIREMADAMVATGMRDAGYRYLVIDDCWQVVRDGRGNIVPDPERFPSGMKVLADYVHSKGLLFGLYSDAGTKTCQGRPGSHGFETNDANLYAAWGVDYLKYDWCNTQGIDPKAAYPAMRDALSKCGRPIVFSMCEWGTSKPWLWAKDVGNLWRTTGDIQDCWDCRRDWGGMGWTHILDLQVGLENHAGPGHWNDPDMLEVGNGGMGIEEYRAHFSFWCLLAAPLMAGNDLRSMSKETVDILTNREAIAVNQDPLGRQGFKVRDEGNIEVWAKPLKDGGKAVILFNRSSILQTLSVRWEEIGYPAGHKTSVRDLWLNKDLGTFKNAFFTAVQARGVAMIRTSP